MYAQICLAVQGELENAFPGILKELALEAKRTVAYLLGILEQNSADVDEDVSQCKAVLRKIDWKM